jgi:peroxiredoxin
MSKKRKILILSTSILLMSVVGIFLLQDRMKLRPLAARQEAPRVGLSAPDFELTDLNGTTVRLSRFRGRSPIFLNFWASWCPACRQEAPQNEQLFQRFGPKGLEFLMINVDQGPAAAHEVRKFVEEFKLSFLPLLDPEHEVLDRYAVIAIPTTFLIDRTGVIVAKIVGPKNWTNSEWQERFEKLFN